MNRVVNRIVCFSILYLFVISSSVFSESGETKTYHRIYRWPHFNRKRYKCEFLIPKSDLILSQQELGITNEDKKFRYPGFSYSGSHGTDTEMRLARQKWEKQVDELRRAHYQNLKKKGFLVLGNYLVLDLKGLYQKNAARMAKHREQLMRTARKHQFNEWEFCKLVLSFVQQIKYNIPPDYRDDLYTGQIYTPPEVLINKEGDCDSKSLLLSTLVMSDRTEVILLDGPRHVLAGIEGYPRKGDYFIRLQNKFFILCEASAGPWLPGHISKDTILEFQQGKYEFVRLK